MKISVVIPAYNEEKLLPRTIKSVQDQTRKADEIIVVDAQSTDDTPSVAKKLGAKVIGTEHKTIGFARQAGLLKSTGDVVVFTDADTIHPRDWLSKMELWLSEPNVVGVFGGFRAYNGAWWYMFFINVIQPFLNTMYFRLFRFPMATGQNMGFWKDKALSVGGFPIEYKIAEDIEIARRLGSIGTIIFRQDFTVSASGRRGNEGIQLLFRTAKAFTYYLLFRKADKIGFPDIRS